MTRTLTDHNTTTKKAAVSPIRHLTLKNSPIKKTPTFMPSSSASSVDTSHTTTIYKNNPYQSVPIRIDTSASAETLYSQVTDIIKVLCPFLSFGNGSPLSIRPLTGGLSNHLFLVSSSSNHNAQDTPSTVLVRIHPESGSDHSSIPQDHQPPLSSLSLSSSSTTKTTSSSSSASSFSIVNRELENRFAAWLATQTTATGDRLAPTVFGRFENGRVEEFYDHVRPLSCSEMKHYAPYIAPQMASFHQLPDPSDNILPRPATATLYDTMEAWLQEADSLLRQQSADDEVERALLTRLVQEWKWLKAQLSQEPSSDNATVQAAYRFIRRIAVTHMDCQPLNILVDQSSPEIPPQQDNTLPLRLIDFEYSGWNPVAADIGNTFCEYCEMSNLQADYEAEYPTAAQQDDFFWYYCQAHPQVDDDNTLPRDRASQEWKEFSKALQHEVGRFSLLSHLGWAAWSVVKSKEKDGVDFDYVFYANHRMEGYEWAKNKFFRE
jgi:thiamine kinase-like enzyme